MISFEDFTMKFLKIIVVTNIYFLGIIDHLKTYPIEFESTIIHRKKYYYPMTPV